MRRFTPFGTVYTITSIQTKLSNIQKERFFLFRIHPYLECIRRDVGKLISDFWMSNNRFLDSSFNVYLFPLFVSIQPIDFLPQ